MALPRPSSDSPAALRLFGRVCALSALLLIAGCSSWWRPLPTPPEVTQAGLAASVLVPSTLNVNPPETVVKPGAGQAPPEPTAAQPPDLERTTFALTDAIAFALRHSPRLRSARAAIERARGQVQVAFSPFLPQIDLVGQYGTVSATFAPGIPGNEGFILPSTFGTRGYAETELALEWTLYDFGRTGGHYRQAGARERIAELQLVRADQTVEFDVAAAYMDVLLARASRRVQEDAIRRAEATLEDTVARRKGGVALKEDVLRAEVELSESREGLVVAREKEFDAVARLNNAMGRNAGWPLEVIDLETQPPLPGTLAELLELAASQRPEVNVAREAIIADQEGQRAAQAEFLPRIFARVAAGRTDGQNVITGWQEGAGLHFVAPLYSGGAHRGGLRSAAADSEAAIADAQTILDGISLQVNLAYRGVVASRELIDLSRVAVAQAQENLRLLRVRYRNGNATPTDIVDSEAALTRSQQRFYSATYSYLAALARLDYEVGQRQDAFPPKKADATVPEVLPLPRQVQARPDPREPVRFADPEALPVSGQAQGSRAPIADPEALLPAPSPSAEIRWSRSPSQ
jgi:outer membrane protein